MNTIGHTLKLMTEIKKQVTYITSPDHINHIICQVLQDNDGDTGMSLLKDYDVQ